MDENVIRYSVAGGDDALRVGAVSELADVTRAHAVGCYSLFLDDMLRQKKYGIEPYHVIPGCGAAYPWQAPYGRADAAWVIYSSDGVRYEEFSEPYIDIRGSTESYRVETFAVCRRPMSQLLLGGAHLPVRDLAFPTFVGVVEAKSTSDQVVPAVRVAHRVGNHAPLAKFAGLLHAHTNHAPLQPVTAMFRYNAGQTQERGVVEGLRVTQLVGHRTCRDREYGRKTKTVMKYPFEGGATARQAPNARAELRKSHSASVPK